MSAVFTETYIGDQASQRKALELVSNNSLLHHILAFLLACPIEIIERGPEGMSKAVGYQTCFEAILPCLITPNDQVRRTALKVMDRVFANADIMAVFGESDKVKDPTFKKYLWTLT